MTLQAALLMQSVLILMLCYHNISVLEVATLGFNTVNTTQLIQDIGQCYKLDLVCVRLKTTFQIAHWQICNLFFS